MRGHPGRGIVVDAAGFDFRIGQGPATKMMREFRQFAATKQGVPLTANLFSFLRHKLLRQFIGAEYQGEYLDGGFEFLRHHIIRAELVQLLQFAQIASPLATCTVRLVINGSEIAITNTFASSILMCLNTCGFVASP